MTVITCAHLVLSVISRTVMGEFGHCKPTLSNCPINISPSRSLGGECIYYTLSLSCLDSPYLHNFTPSHFLFHPPC
jgi:hypothetical protein